MSETTNTTTADLATERGVLPLRNLQLIGVVGTEDNRRALLRTPNGQISTVRVGDDTRQGTVAAIDADAIILASGTGARVLRMPEPAPAPRVAA